MPKASYQYGTSPRKYEPEYTRRKVTKKSTTQKTAAQKVNVQKNVNKQKSENKKRTVTQRTKKVQEKKNKFVQIVVVLAIFGMLLALSYREILIMEMFNHKKSLENQLAVIEKENGQVEKSIKEEESKLDWNEIKRRATEELGMQIKTGTPVDLEKSDNVETKNTLIEEEETNIIEKIISYFINK